MKYTLAYGLFNGLKGLIIGLMVGMISGRWTPVPGYFFLLTASFCFLSSMLFWNFELKKRSKSKILLPAIFVDIVCHIGSWMLLSFYRVNIHKEELTGLVVFYLEGVMKSIVGGLIEMATTGAIVTIPLTVFFTYQLKKHVEKNGNEGYAERQEGQ